MSHGIHFAFQSIGLVLISQPALRCQIISNRFIPFIRLSFGLSGKNEWGFSGMPNQTGMFLFSSSSTMLLHVKQVIGSKGFPQQEKKKEAKMRDIAVKDLSHEFHL